MFPLNRYRTDRQTTMTDQLLITIDGPAGAGKTTVSRMLADRLEYRYVDTGALYRGVAYAARAARVDPADEDALAALFQSMRLSFRRSAGENRLFLDGEDISDRIRTPAITMMASAISAHKIVRQNLLALQRNLGKNKAAVFEGRDMGTVVFPDADLKFYLDASLAKRARRRFCEMPAGSGQTLEMIEKDMRIRDRNDASRDIAPLRAADDAVCIDSSDLSAEAVVAVMLAKIQQRLSK